MTTRPIVDCGHMAAPLLTLLLVSSGLQPVSDTPPEWALLEAWSCTACHANAGEELGMRPHAPSLRQGWYRPAFVLDHLETEHARGRTPGVPGLMNPANEAVALEGLRAFFEASRLPGDGIALDLVALERGRRLYNEVGCVACHEPYEDADTLETRLWEFEELFGGEEGGGSEAPTPFPRIRGKFVARGLAGYLASPAGHAPNLAIDADEAEVLARYLWFEEQGDSGAAIESGPGLLYEYYEGVFRGYDLEAEGNVPVRRGVAATPRLVEPRAENFAFRFRGFLEVPTTGWYTFATVSDDGSWLWIDGELVVDNGGLHAPATVSERVRLDAGQHAIEIGFFEHTGGEELAVTWEGPGFERGPLPAGALSHKRIALPRDERRVDTPTGEPDGRLLTALGCNACHDPGPTTRRSTPLGKMSRKAGKGCLAAEPRAGLPRYSLDDAQRAALGEALARGVQAPAPAEHLDALLEGRGCLSCHSRDGAGGPAEDRMAYFQVDSHAELGDEGRIPPHLDDVGSKLYPGWMEEVIREGARSRPYMRTRMPRFPADAGRLTRLFQELDASPEDLVEPPFDVTLVEVGRDLVGTDGGLGCIQCHEFAGYPSLGVPAVDLARVHERIKPAWFKELLLDPIAINMNTRMPTFWTDGKSPVTAHFDGDPLRQIDAIWTYLSLESSMPLPEGLVAHESEYELDAARRPTLVSVFAKGLSPRTLFVGYPERMHVAFDVEHSRLALAWRGRFFNARGTWHGRAGELEEPWGEDVLELPSGPPFARLTDAAAPWPSEAGRTAGYRVLGRRFDAERRPVFRYAYGAIEIEERVVPTLGEDGGSLVREFALRSPEPVDGLYFRRLDDARRPVHFAREGEGYSANFAQEVTW